MPTHAAGLDPRFLRRVARGVSQGDLEAGTRQLQAELAALSFKKASAKVLNVAGECKAQQQHGQMCAAILLGAMILGEPFLAEVDGGRLLIDGTEAPRFARVLDQFSARLQRATGALQTLQRRFSTYRAYQQLRADAFRKLERAARITKSRPFLYGRSLVAFTNLSFLVRYFGLAPTNAQKALLARFSGPEDVSSAASAVLAITNDARTLEIADFSFPVTSLEITEELIELLEYGRTIDEVKEVEKHLTSLGYDLIEKESIRGRVFALVAPSEDYERYRRLGFIRSETGSGASRLSIARSGAQGLPSIFAVVDDLLRQRESVVTVVDGESSLRRLRINAPLMPELIQQIADWRFYEDALMDEQLAQELELPMSLDSAVPPLLVADLDWETFGRAWRILRFLAVVDVVSLRKHQSDPQLIANSLLRIMPVDALLELLRAGNVSSAASSAFVSLISTSVATATTWDLQYRPLVAPTRSEVTGFNHDVLTTREEVVFASAVVTTANIVSNVLRAHSLRVKSHSEILVSLAVDALRPVVSLLRTNAEVKDGEGRTDIDIVAVGRDAIYLFECKHSLPPTGPHETRDLWKDIRKGVGQLAAARRILGSKRNAYLNGWFPGIRASVAALPIKTCILCSHRVFSGLEIEGTVVRDYASLTTILGDAIVHMGYRDDAGQVILKRFRLRQAEAATEADLADYLSDSAVFFRMFERHLVPYSGVTTLANGTRIARESFVYHAELRSWIQNLESIGARRLEDEGLTVGPGAWGPDD